MNSPHTELLPREQPDGRLLFGSDRPGGPGGRDLFLATPPADGQWRVEPLPAPVNSPADEYEADLSTDDRRPLFAQAQGEDSGELFLIDLQPGATPSWPPSCP